VVEKVVAIWNQRWLNCAGFKVVEIEENGSRFAVARRGRRTSEPKVSYNIDVVKRSCDCGEWQDHGVPYIDAIAFFP
jgi:hypothetical protein